MIYFSLAAVAMAGVIHRISGLGFALAAIPLLSVAYGPTSGTSLGLILGTCVSVVVLATTWRSVSMAMTALLTLPGLLLIPAGLWTARHVAQPPQSIALGLTLTVLLITQTRATPVARQGPVEVGVCGATSGFVHAVSGLSAAVLALGAIRGRWPQDQFVTSAQVVFIAFNVIVLAGREHTRSELLTSVVLIPALVLGVAAGSQVAARISSRTGRTVSVCVALLAAVAIAGKGAVELIT